MTISIDSIGGVIEDSLETRQLLSSLVGRLSLTAAIKKGKVTGDAVAEEILKLNGDKSHATAIAALLVQHGYLEPSKGTKGLLSKKVPPDSNKIHYRLRTINSDFPVDAWLQGANPVAQGGRLPNVPKVPTPPVVAHPAPATDSGGSGLLTQSNFFFFLLIALLLLLSLVRADPVVHNGLLVLALLVVLLCMRQAPTVTAAAPRNMSSEYSGLPLPLLFDEYARSVLNWSEKESRRARMHSAQGASSRLSLTDKSNGKKEEKNTEAPPMPAAGSPPIESFSDPYIDHHISKYADSKKVLFHLVRTKNCNTVMFEVCLGPDGKLDQTKFVCNYWFDIDAKLALANIKAGKPECRSDTNGFENRMAYGISAKRNAEGKVKVQIVSLAQREWELVEKDGNYSLEDTYDGKLCRLRKVFVNSKEKFPLPQVLYVLIYWEVVETGDILTEKVNIK